MHTGLPQPLLWDVKVRARMSTTCRSSKGLLTDRHQGGQGCVSTPILCQWQGRTLALHSSTLWSRSKPIHAGSHTTTSLQTTVVKDCVQDLCFVAKLHFFKCIASQLQPFLSKYQTDRPMIPFLADDLCMMTRSLMRLIKKDILQSTSDDKLVKIDVADQKIHLSYKRVDVGFASEKLNGTANRKPSERQVMEFRMESTTCLIELLKKLLEKCPITYSLVRHLSCLNPVKMASHKQSCSNSTKFWHCCWIRTGWKRKTVILSCSSIACSWTAFLLLEPTNLPILTQVWMELISSFLNAWLGRVTRTSLMLWNFSLFCHMARRQLREASASTSGSWKPEGKVTCRSETCLWPCEECWGLFNVELNKSLLLSVRLSMQKYEKYPEQEREGKNSSGKDQSSL